MTEPYDAGAEEQVEAARDEAEKAARLADADFKGLTAHPAGRRLIWALLERCGVFRTSYRGDPLATAFAEGERNIGLEYLHRLHRLCPEQYLAMLKDRLADEMAARSAADNAQPQEP